MVVRKVDKERSGGFASSAVTPGGARSLRLLDRTPAPGPPIRRRPVLAFARRRRRRGGAGYHPKAATVAHRGSPRGGDRATKAHDTRHTPLLRQGNPVVEPRDLVHARQIGLQFHRNQPPAHPATPRF